MQPIQLVITHKFEFTDPQVLAILTQQVLPTLGNLATRLTHLEGVITMAVNNIDQAIADLTLQVQNNTTVDASVVTFINGIPALIAAAVAAAQNAGATPTQVQAFTDLGTSIKASADSVVAAINANVPPPVVGGGGGPTPTV